MFQDLQSQTLPQLQLLSELFGRAYNFEASRLVWQQEVKAEKPDTKFNKQGNRNTQAVWQEEHKTNSLAG